MQEALDRIHTFRHLNSTEGGKPFAAYAARALLRVDLHADGDDWAVFNDVKAAKSHVEAVLCFGAVVADDTAVLNGAKAVVAHVEAVLSVNAPVSDDAAVVNGVPAVAAHVEVFLSAPQSATTGRSPSAARPSRRVGPRRA